MAEIARDSQAKIEDLARAVIRLADGLKVVGDWGNYPYGMDVQIAATDAKRAAFTAAPHLKKKSDG